MNQSFRSTSRRSLGQRLNAAFSLVEVALAVGVVGFGMTVILGCLPVGLLSVKDSKIQSAKANIARQLRGELQQIKFPAQGSATENGFTTIDDLKSEEYLYTQEGMPTTDAKEAYYKASFAVNDATTSSTKFLLDSARAVEVNLSYPQAAPVANQEKTSFSLFVARQMSLSRN